MASDEVEAALEAEAQGDGSKPRPGRRKKERSDETWPSLVQAARQSGISHSTLRRMVKEGAITSKVVAGVIRICPDELAQTSDENVNPIQLLSAAHSHVQKMVDLVVAPNEKLLALLIAENEHLRKRCGDLEEQHLKVLGVVEEAHSLSHERELARQRAERQDERVDEGLKQLYEILPKVLSQAVGRTKVQEVIDSLSDEQVQMLKEIGAIDEEQVELLKGIRRERRKEAAKRGNGVPVDATVGEEKS